MRQRLLIFLLGACCLVVAACGTKGPVRPLKKKLPAAPVNLQVQQLGLRMLVSWAPPQRNQDGSPLDDLSGYRVYRMEYDPAEDCPECRDTSVLLEKIDLDYLQRARRFDGRLYLWDADIGPGRGYQYRVVATTEKGREGQPVQQRRPFLLPPAPPADLTARAHDRLVRLSWQPVPTSLGYRVYRRLPDTAFSPIPIHDGILSASAFEDFTVENDRTYHYAVRSVLERRGLKVESPLSASVEANPRPGL